MNIDKNWVNWAAECTAEGFTQEQLIKAMIDAGFQESQASMLISGVKNLPIYDCYNTLSQRHKKLESVVDNYKKILQQDPFFDRIERVTQLTNKEFFYQHWLPSVPVIITDYAKDWDAMNKWTFNNLSEKYGEAEVEIQDNRSKDPNYEINGYKHKHKVNFADFVKRVTDVGESNDFYMTANNGSLENSPLKELFNDAGTVPEYMNRELPHSGYWHLWIGPKGTVTPTHHDVCSLVHLQVVGSKKWWLVHPLDTPNIYNHHHVYSKVDLEKPDYDKYPRLKNAHIYEITVNSGEALFLPVGWWHSVKSLEPSISISMTDFVYPNTWKYANVQGAL